MSAIDNHNARVVITGTGILCPLGLDMPTTWEGLINGRSGIDYITLCDTTQLETKFAGEVKGFEPTNYMDRKDTRRMDRFAQLAVAASLQAVKESGLQINPGNQYNVGVIIGSGIGGLTTLFEQARVLIEKGPDRVSPFLAPMMIADIAAANVSIVLGIRGPNLCTTSACSSGSDAIGAAYQLIRDGDVDVMVAGGAEAILNPLGITAFNALKALSTRNSEPKLASRPFDADRDGFVLSEGACSLILESLDHARGRGAHILAEVLSYGATADAFHITQPIETGEGAAKAMQIAIKKAGITPDQVDYINAHGTSTPLNDVMETRAIKTAFGDCAYRVPVSSTKSMTGHLIGAAGAAEAAFCVMAIQHGIMPPTINLVHAAPDCDLDYVPNVARKKEINIVLSNSFGFGGHNSVLVFRKYVER